MAAGDADGTLFKHSVFVLSQCYGLYNSDTFSPQTYSIFGLLIGREFDSVLVFFILRGRGFKGRGGRMGRGRMRGGRGPMKGFGPPRHERGPMGDGPINGFAPMRY